MLRIQGICFKKNKEDQFSRQWSVVSFQFSVVRCRLANEVGASSIVFGLSSRQRSWRFVVFILAPGGRERKRFVQKSTFCQPAGAGAVRHAGGG
jgi:hypothetical protein